MGAVTILGIGNLLWADEGFGVRCVEHLNRHYHFEDNVEIVDGGTQGIYLLEYVQRANTLVVFDAVDYGLAPGSLKLVHDEQVPQYLGARKMSLHQNGFQEVLALAALTGQAPEHILLVGVQPLVLDDYGGSLSAVVRETIPAAISAALDWLELRGESFSNRQPARSDQPDDIQAAALNLPAYENGRPTEDAAWRLGDERILRDTGYHFSPKPVDLEKPFGSSGPAADPDAPDHADQPLSSRRIYL